MSSESSARPPTADDLGIVIVSQHETQAHCRSGFNPTLDRAAQRDEDVGDRLGQYEAALLGRPPVDRGPLEALDQVGAAAQPSEAIFAASTSRIRLREFSIASARLR